VCERVQVQVIGDVNEQEPARERGILRVLRGRGGRKHEQGEEGKGRAHFDLGTVFGLQYSVFSQTAQAHTAESFPAEN
jgi:hypothetical protein